MLYILIAVSLIAALSYAVAQSGRGNVQQLSQEQARLRAAEIIEYGNVLPNASSQLRLRGYSDAEISIENSVDAGHVNPGCTDNNCKIFHPAGGGVSYRTLAADWLDATFTASTMYGSMTFYARACVEGTGCEADGFDNEELMVFFPYLKKEICVEINDKLGITNPAGDPPVDADCSGAGNTQKFVGAYTQSDAVDVVGDHLDFKMAGCFQVAAGCATGPLSYAYYQVLISR